MEQARLSLKLKVPMVQTVLEIKASRPDLEFYIMSNISRVSLLQHTGGRWLIGLQEHFEFIKSTALPWWIFEKAFASGIEGMRKPDLCFFQHVIKEIGLHPSEIIMIDDMHENVCAARSQGIHAVLVEDSWPSVGRILWNLIQDPLQRAEVFLKDNARNHHCVIEGHEEISLKDNFAQLMIWELTDDEDIIYLKWPSGKTHGIHPSEKGHLKYDSLGRPNDGSDGNAGLWDYFLEGPVLTTSTFPPDAETTATAYLSLPTRYLSTVPDVHLVLEKMATNLDLDGIMQIYFDPSRPRSVPDAGCNILRVFHKFGAGSDPRIKATEDYVVDCLQNNACLNGNRHYTTPESFLYFVARLHAETRSESLRKRLDTVKAQLRGRLNVPVNPLALAFRIFACQTMGIDRQLYRNDLKTLLSLQDEDGGWPAGHFRRIARTGARIGNRGLTAALAVRILRRERQDEVSNSQL